MDTTLELHDATGAVVGYNDHWESDQKQQIEAILPPTDSHESAILATLMPGGYTGIVRGKGGSAGVARVEVSRVE